MRRLPTLPVALRTLATVAAGFAALVALAGTSEAEMLRDDCFTRIAPACQQIRDVDAAHRCVIRETNACEVRIVLRRDRAHARPRPRAAGVLDTVYSQGEPGGAVAVAADAAAGGPDPSGRR
ncbi:hypothetical protein ACTZWW_18690 [Salinarimonas sp. NSM]|uniref:hypothetical protein n=1 Tax=Salinarimonas sp. NSM TaxID=3458003 RepID=UPI00403523DE